MIIKQKGPNAHDVIRLYVIRSNDNVIGTQLGHLRRSDVAENYVGGNDRVVPIGSESLPKMVIYGDGSD
jgi:hypothetical protein